MSDAIINIRFGCRHFMVTKGFNISFKYNKYHEGNPKRFEVYNFFGYYR